MKQSPSKSVDNKSTSDSKIVIKKEPGVSADLDDDGTGKGICINNGLF